MIESIGISVGPQNARVSIPLGGITALIGANDAGKSSLLQAVYSTFVGLNSAPEHRADPNEGFLALGGKQTSVLSRLEDAAIPTLAGFDSWSAAGSSAGRHDIVARTDSQTVWLACPAGAVVGDKRLTALASQARIDVAAYPEWMPIPLIQATPEIPSALRSSLPLALECPIPPDVLLHRIQHATAVLLEAFTDVRAAALAGHLVDLDVDALEEASQLRWLEWQQSASADAWLYPALHSIDSYETVHPDLMTVSSIFSTLLERALPSFITDPYACFVSPSSLSAWIRGEPRIGVSILNRRTGAEFPADRLAEGFRLWMQLALIDSSLDLAQLGSWLREAFSDSQRALAGPSAWAEDVAPAVQALRDLDVLPARKDPMSTPAALDQLARACSPSADPGGLDDLGRSTSLISLLDEPERQLHPRLQRQAARWIAARSDVRSTSYLIATHSVSFMDTDGATQFLHVQRGVDGNPRVKAIDARALQATDAVADELGLNRGELLGFVDRIVFVEGITDQAFIEALYGPELRASRIVLLPLGGATRTNSVIPMTELLLRFTTAPVTVILDDVLREKFDRLTIDSAFRTQSTRDKQVELRELARLVQAAIELERDITASAISTKDIFDLIDETVVAEHLAKAGKQRFPGHTKARSLVGEGKWKSAYNERYGIDILDVNTFANAGAEMRRRGLDIPELRDLLAIKLGP